MHLPYDPADGAAFWGTIRQLPGYPAGEEVRLQEMIFERDALLRLPALLRRFDNGAARPTLVVADATPMRRGADDLKPLLVSLLRQAERPTELFTLTPDHGGEVHTTMAQIAALQARLAPEMAVVAVGSGSVADIAKHACFQFERARGCRIPLALYQTANSVSAFTSNMAPVFMDGVKRTIPSRYPDALVCDLETLRGAPYAMTAAGVGDLLAAFVSLPDWYLAHRLGLDPSYNTFPQTLLGPLDDILLSAAPSISSRTLEGMATLAKLIALGGLAMSLVGATTPLSGFEHVISHVLDLLAEHSGRPLAHHGAQVAIASRAAALSYQRLFTAFDPQALDMASCYPDETAMQRQVEQAFLAVDPSGKAGAECWADYRIKLSAWRAHKPEFTAFLGAWPEIRRELQQLARPPEQIAAIMRAVGLPQMLATLTPPIPLEDARFAFLHAALMRRRFTIGDLLLFIGWDREALWRDAAALL
jgi:glycerol-1-phosphate dehydrogenase [NAD(P)+]